MAFSVTINFTDLEEAAIIRFTDEINALRNSAATPTQVVRARNNEWTHTLITRYREKDDQTVVAVRAKMTPEDKQLLDALVAKYP